MKKIIWNDPDPIKDNDYTVREIINIGHGTALIQYGDESAPYLSEAEVYIGELEVVDDDESITDEKEHHYAKLLEEAKEGNEEK